MFKFFTFIKKAYEIDLEIFKIKSKKELKKSSSDSENKPTQLKPTLMRRKDSKKIWHTKYY